MRRASFSLPSRTIALAGLLVGLSALGAPPAASASACPRWLPTPALGWCEGLAAWFIGPAVGANQHAAREAGASIDPHGGATAPAPAYQHEAREAGSSMDPHGGATAPAPPPPSAALAGPLGSAASSDPPG